MGVILNPGTLLEGELQSLKIKIRITPRWMNLEDIRH